MIKKLSMLLVLVMVMTGGVAFADEGDMYLLLPETTMVQSLAEVSELTDIIEEPNQALRQELYNNLTQRGGLFITPAGGCLVFIPEKVVQEQWMSGRLEIVPTVTIYVPRDSIVKIKTGRN